MNAKSKITITTIKIVAQRGFSSCESASFNRKKPKEMSLRSFWPLKASMAVLAQVPMYLDRLKEKGTRTLALKSGDSEYIIKNSVALLAAAEKGFWSVGRGSKDHFAESSFSVARSNW